MVYCHLSPPSLFSLQKHFLFSQFLSHSPTCCGPGGDSDGDLETPDARSGAPCQVGIYFFCARNLLKSFAPSNVSEPGTAPLSGEEPGAAYTLHSKAKSHESCAGQNQQEEMMPLVSPSLPSRGKPTLLVLREGRPQVTSLGCLGDEGCGVSCTWASRAKVPALQLQAFQWWACICISITPD